MRVPLPQSNSTLSPLSLTFSQTGLFVHNHIVGVKRSKMYFHKVCPTKNVKELGTHKSGFFFPAESFSYVPKNQIFSSTELGLKEETVEAFQQVKTDDDDDDDDGSACHNCPRLFSVSSYDDLPGCQTVTNTKRGENLQKVCHLQDKPR